MHQAGDPSRGQVSEFGTTVQPLSRRQTIATFEMGRSSPCIEQPCRRNRKWRIFWPRQETTSGTMRSTGGREEDMTDQGFGRRDFLKTAVAGGAAAAATATPIPVRGFVMRRPPPPATTGGQ